MVYNTSSGNGAVLHHLVGQGMATSAKQWLAYMWQQASPTPGQCTLSASSTKACLSRLKMQRLAQAWCLLFHPC